MHTRLTCLFAGALALAACGPSSTINGGGPDSGMSSAPDSGSYSGGPDSAPYQGGGDGGSSICSTQNCVVYASADHDLYQVDPSTLNFTHLCAFNGALGSTTQDIVTDIAVTNKGALYAITETALYTVDPKTCAATKVSSLSQSGTRWVGLSFTVSGKLLAADGKGNVDTIDPASGTVTPAGSFGNGLACSGDIVGINDANKTIYATAIDTTCSGSSCTDKLVTLDPGNSYAATVVGDIGYSRAFGLGYWGGKLYGFTHAGLTLQIQPSSGSAKQIGMTSPAVSFSGGATTPVAPVIIH